MPLAITKKYAPIPQGFAITVLMLSFAAVACSAADAEQVEQRSENPKPHRSPSGKADQSGRCVSETRSYCGGKSAGSCWCDELCTEYKRLLRRCRLLLPEPPRARRSRTKHLPRRQGPSLPNLHPPIGKEPRSTDRQPPRRGRQSGDSGKAHRAKQEGRGRRLHSGHPQRQRDLAELPSDLERWCLLWVRRQQPNRRRDVLPQAP